MCRRLSLTLTVLGAGILALSGCRSNSPESRHDDVSDDLTPELDTLSKRHVEVSNRRTLTYDENWRMLQEDWERLWLVDRPSRLARPRVPR